MDPIPSSAKLYYVKQGQKEVGPVLNDKTQDMCNLLKLISVFLLQKTKTSFVCNCISGAIC